MANPSDSTVQNLLPVQAYFDVQGNFQTFIGQGKPFYAVINPNQSGLNITNSTINSTTIGVTSPAVAYFTSGYVSVAPTTATGIANKQYVDYYAAGLSWKQPVKAASLSNIASLSGFQTIDAVPLTDGDRVLVKDQSLSKNNGIYVVRSGAWEYAVGADDWQEYVGAIVFVEEGSQAYSAWYCLAQEGGTLGVTALDWANFSVSSTYTAGTGLTLNAGVFSITNTGVINATYGSATASAVIAVNAQGQITSASNATITPAVGSITGLGTGVATALAVNIGSSGSVLVNGGALGTPASGNFSSGTFTWPTFNQNTTGTAAGLSATLAIASGGTGQTTASAAFNALSPITTTGDLIIGNGTNSATRLAIGANNTVLTSNGTTASWVAGSGFMVYPGAGIPNSTGSAWGTSYSTTGSGTVVALATNPTLYNPNIDVIDFDTAYATALTAGQMGWDSTNNSLAYGMTGGNIVQHIGEDQYLYIKASATITKGQVIMFTGSVGASGVLTGAPATGLTDGTYIIGVAAESIANNAFGFVQTFGVLTNVNTASFSDGDILWYDPSVTGGLTATKPSAPNIKAQVAACNKGGSAGGGVITVRVNAGSALGGTDSNVQLSSPTGGQILSYNQTGQYWSNINLTAGTGISITPTTGGAITIANTVTGGITITDDTTTNATRYLTFTSATSGTITGENVSSTKLQYNPSTGLLTSTAFSGSGASLTSLNAGNISSGTLGVANGGTGATTLTGVLKGNGTSAFTAATAGTDFVAPGTATTFTALQTFAGTSSNADLKTSNIIENATISATAATGTINYDITTQSVLYYTSNASGNFTVNFRGSSGTSLNTVMSTGESLSVTFLVTNGSTAYYNSAVQVDGSSVTPKWLGGTAPTAGNASSIDVYVYSIIKTGSAAFTVLASQSRYA